MQCPSCGTAVNPGQKFCMECGSSLRGVADDTGEVPVIRDQTPPPAARDEVTEAMGRLSAREQAASGVADDRTTGFPPPNAATTAGAAATSRAAGVDPLLQGPNRAGDPSTEERFYGGHEPWGNGDPDATATLTRTAHPTTGRLGATGEMYTGASTDEREYVYDDQAWTEEEWTAEHEPPRTFRFRVVFLAAALAAAASVVGVLSDLISIRPGAGVTAPFDTGTWMVNDFGTNNTVAAILAASVIVVGAILWCFGFRWGAGLAGGAGLSLSGWAALMIGLAEWPIFTADQAADAVPTAITRELGYWALVATAGLGLVVFCTSLSGSGRDRQGGLDPWIAALGAAAFLVAAGGPLIPLGTADFSGNFSSDSLGVDLPQMFFIGRLLQLAFLAFTGIVGFLLVRRFGLGMAVGGAVGAGYMLVTAATNQTATPIGPAFANPGAVTLDPHGVTVVGFALAGFFALVAVVMALLDSER